MFETLDTISQIVTDTNCFTEVKQALVCVGVCVCVNLSDISVLDDEDCSDDLINKT